MEIKVADERILVIAESLTSEEAEKKAWEKKVDIGADAAGMLIPGGSIAVKVAKKYIEHKAK